MPSLDWIGKEAVVNHHLQIPFHLLEDVPELSCGESGDGNLIVQGTQITIRCEHGGAACQDRTRWLVLVFPPTAPLYSHAMSIRKAGGDWEPMLLPIEPRHCKVCKQGLYRDKTMFRGGWSRCTVCDEFVHYSCLASGKFSFLKARPRVCKTCRATQANPQGTADSADPAVAVGS